MTVFRKILLFMIGVAAASRPCTGERQLRINTASTPVVADAPVDLTLCWSGSAGDQFPSGPVLMKFSDQRSGNVWHDRHFVPLATPEEPANADWSAAYTIPVFLPDVSSETDWTISVHTSDADYPDRLVLRVSEPSPHRRHVPFETGMGWHPALETRTPDTAGFFDIEQDPASSDRWRWMSGSAWLEIPDPGSSCRLVLDAVSPLHGDIRCSVQAGGNDVPVRQPEPGKFAVDHQIPAEWFGSGGKLRLTISVDRTFVPAADGTGSDTRELGLMIRTLNISVPTGTPDLHPVIDLIRPEIIVPQWRPVGGEFDIRFAHPGKPVDIFLKGKIVHPRNDSGGSLEIRLLSDTILVRNDLEEDFAVRFRIPLDALPAEPLISMAFCLKPAFPDTAEADPETGLATQDILQPVPVDTIPVRIGSPSMIVTQLWIE